MHKACSVLLLASLGLPLGAQAVEFTLLAGVPFNADFEVEIGEPPVTNSTDGEGDVIELDGDAVFGLALDFELRDRPNSRIGLWLSHQQAEFAARADLAAPDMTVTHLHFTAMNYYPSGNWEPFVLAGVGAGFFDPEDAALKNKTQLSAQIGAGANYRLSNTLSLRMEVRWVPTFFDGGGAIFCSGGCKVALRSDVYSQFQANLGMQLRF